MCIPRAQKSSPEKGVHVLNTMAYLAQLSCAKICHIKFYCLRQCPSGRDSCYWFALQNPPSATWPPMAIVTKHDHPTTAHESPGFVRGHPKTAIFRPPRPENGQVLAGGAPLGSQSGKIGDSTQDPRHWFGDPYKRRKWNGTWVRIVAQWRLQAN